MFLTVLMIVMVTTLAMVLVDAEPQVQPIRPARRGVRLRVTKVAGHGSHDM
jgi:hypothetical protein